MSFLVVRKFALATLPALFAGAALAQTPDSTVKQPETRSTGLPSKGTWTFNIDAGVGYFSFGNSLYSQSRPDDPPAGTGANWAEGWVRPALSGVLPSGKSEFYGKISVVGERTFAAPPPLVGSDASSYGLDDFYIGWRSGTSISAGENAVDLKFGSARYTIGQGLLVWDGAGEGGSRGGYWSNARMAWKYAGIAKFNVKSNLLEFFYLDRNEVPNFDQGSKLWGANYQRSLGELTTLGVSYFRTASDSNANRNGMNVLNLRAFTVPFKSLPDLAIDAEYVNEKNGDVLNSMAWYAQASYQLSHKGWKPKLWYRYAFFEGDKVSTTKNEAFDPLFTGFYDWGTWWQGEIAGEYFLSNSNLISNQLRLSFAPSEKLNTGLIAYQFKFDQLPSGVTSKDIAVELDAYADWKANSNITFSFVAAYGNPQKGTEQAFNRTGNFAYGMIYLAYAY